ncbi:kinase-like domain-containing protein [Fusarium tricinctum]|uniref:non-specific serine/threonine protein kinase n=1 Tax=Fusarium tricinctum TaxID=61284 RepID=A0A8K0SAK0_9HYPO|nr:kinase-like domain-containing protein [Fusarium tricinctum]
MANTSAWTEEDRQLALGQDPAFPTCHYRRGCLLGQGGYARVYKVLDVWKGAVYAGKSSPEAVKHLRKEAKILRNLSHPNIVKYIEYYEERDYPSANVLVMELCAGGSLQTMINNHTEGLTQKDTLHVLNQVSQAIEYLHSKKRFHGDLKPRNILIRKWNPVDIVVADCAEIMHEGKSDDMWAIGISLLGMMSQWPSYYQNEQRLYPRRCASHARNLDRLNPGHEIVKLLVLLLEWDHKRRIDASQLVALTAELLEARIVKPEGTPEPDKMCLEAPEGFQAVEFW